MVHGSITLLILFVLLFLSESFLFYYYLESGTCKTVKVYRYLYFFQIYPEQIPSFRWSCKLQFEKGTGTGTGTGTTGPTGTGTGIGTGRTGTGSGPTGSFQQKLNYYIEAPGISVLATLFPKARINLK